MARMAGEMEAADEAVVVAVVALTTGATVVVTAAVAPEMVIEWKKDVLDMVGAVVFGLVLVVDLRAEVARMTYRSTLHHQHLRMAEEAAVGSLTEEASFVVVAVR